MGNARSFLLAWLWARAKGGRVLMRIEDIDGPRCKPEFAQAALDDLAWLGLDWDEVSYQSDRIEQYRHRLQTLAAAGRAYPCVCSRKDIELASSAPHGDEGAIYPGTCRGRWQNSEHAQAETGVVPAWRMLWDSPAGSFQDALAGEVPFDPAALGDFVLWRRDDLPSYQLAVAVDDALQGVTQVLRGRDLLPSTGRQLALYDAMGLTPPTEWAHVPLMHDATGRMAKRDGALSLETLRENGVKPERLIGFLAWSTGLLAQPTDTQPAELVERFDIASLSRADFTATSEHVAALA